MVWVYMIRNMGDKLYVGVAKDPFKRLNHHNHKMGASFTKNNPSFAIVFLEKYEDMVSARKREIQIKKWRRDKKEDLISIYYKGLKTKI